MPYDDEQYLAASSKLRSAVYTLKNNAISLEDILEMVEEAYEEE